jgi:hypothetical protein
MGFVRLDPSSKHHCAIRLDQTYPGRRFSDAISDAIKPGEIVPVTSWQSFRHIDATGETITIYFFELSDGRGWIHDYNPATPHKRWLEYQHNSSNSSSPPSTWPSSR